MKGKVLISGLPDQVLIQGDLFAPEDRGKGQRQQIKEEGEGKENQRKEPWVFF